MSVKKELTIVTTLPDVLIYLKDMTGDGALRTKLLTLSHALLVVCSSDEIIIMRACKHSYIFMLWMVTY